METVVSEVLVIMALAGAFCVFYSGQFSQGSSRAEFWYDLGHRMVVFALFMSFANLVIAVTDFALTSHLN